MEDQVNKSEHISIFDEGKKREHADEYLMIKSNFRLYFIAKFTIYNMFKFCFMYEIMCCMVDCSNDVVSQVYHMEVHYFLALCNKFLLVRIKLRLEKGR